MRVADAAAPVAAKLALEIREEKGVPRGKHTGEGECLFHLLVLRNERFWGCLGSHATPPLLKTNK